MGALEAIRRCRVVAGVLVLLHLGLARRRKRRAC